MKRNSLFLLFLFVLVSGCANDSAILTKIETIQSAPIDLCISEMMKIDKDGSIKSKENNHKAPFRMVVYTSHKECSTCALNNLSEWSVLFDLEKDNKLEFVFILCPEKRNINHVVDTYLSSGLEHAVYIDTCGIFTQKNPNIPEEAIYHTLLLDSDRNAVLVGNPLKNPQIQTLFENILKDIGESKNKKRQ